MSKIFTVFLFSYIIPFAFLHAQEVKLLSVDEFEKGAKASNVQLLDVRTAGEFKTGHLKHALQADWNNTVQFKDRTQHLDKAKPLFIYCLSGGRSNAAAEWFQQQGYGKIYSLKGGINAWKQANKEVEGMPDIPQMNREEYNTLIKGSETVLVDFGAEWCPPCKKMEPVLEKLKNEEGNKFKLVKIDGGIHTNVMKELNVDALPVFIIYKNGKPVWRKQGIATLDELKSQL